MKLLIFTRFSILDIKCVSAFKSFNVFNENILKEKLFSKDRLDYKFEVFSKVTYPSIINQTFKDYIWLIFTSKYLPEEYKNKLETYRTSNIIIYYVENFSEMRKIMDNELKDLKNFTTIRLDDDDGLMETYLEKLNLYENEKGKIVTFPNGIRYKLDDDKIIYGSQICFPNIACGLTAIEFNIFSAGDHSTIHQRFQIIQNKEKNSYYLCCSEYCDTKRRFF